MEVLDILNLRYNTAIQSNDFSDFSLNVYEYIKLIHDTPELYQLLVYLEKDYYAQVHQYGKSSRKLEKLNLYAAHYIELSIPVYDVIYEYKHSDEPDERQDPAALILLYGTDDTSIYNWYKNRYPGSSHRKIKKEIKNLVNWIGTRDNLQNHLTQFHTDFLTALKTFHVQSNDIATPCKPDTLSLNPTTGQFTFFETHGTLSPSSNSFKVLHTLYTSPDYFATYEDLISSYRVYNPNAKKSQKADLGHIIKAIKHELKILPKSETANPNIFKNVKGSGYQLVLTE